MHVLPCAVTISVLFVSEQLQLLAMLPTDATTVTVTLCSMHVAMTIPSAPSAHSVHLIAASDTFSLWSQAPVFARVVWGFIKGMLSPASKAKVSIVGNGFHLALSELFAPESVPQAYGGLLEWSPVERGHPAYLSWHLSDPVPPTVVPGLSLAPRPPLYTDRVLDDQLSRRCDTNDDMYADIRTSEPSQPTVSSLFEQYPGWCGSVLFVWIPIILILILGESELID